MQDDQSTTSADDQARQEGVVLEDIQDKITQVLEAIDTMKDLPVDVRQLKDDVAELKSDMKVVKAAVTDVSNKVNHHDRQLADLGHSAQ